jgi:glutamate carboxypeptidase
MFLFYFHVFPQTVRLHLGTLSLHPVTPFLAMTQEQQWRAAMTYLDGRQDEMLQLLKNLTERESPSSDSEAVSRLTSHLDTYCGAMDMCSRKIPLAPAGDALLAYTASAGQKPLAILAHIDTVHPRGSWSELFAQDGDILRGPGVFDCKGGIVIGLFAIKALQACGYRKRQIKLILSSDEEVAHTLSQGRGGQFIAEETAGCAAVFNCESGSLANEIVTERKGGAVFRMDITGKTAHAGRNPEQGASAIRTAARLVEAVEALNHPDGPLFNCGRIEGGTGANVIPGSCSVVLGIRYRTNKEYDTAQEQLTQLCNRIPLPHTQIQLSPQGRYPAMEKTPGTQALANLYSQVSQKLGTGPVREISVGGCSDSAFATRSGVPALCSLGISGAHAHTRDEYALLSSLLPQCKKLTGTILSLPDDHIFDGTLQ